MKNKDLIALFQGIQSVEHLRGAKFSYAMAKNKRVLVAELEDVQKAFQPSESYRVYDQERLSICKKMSKKDPSGTAMMDDAGTYDIEDREAFDVAIENLRVKHIEALEERKEQEKDYSALLEEPINGIEFHKIKEECLPDDISTAQVDAIYELIDEGQ